MNGFNTHYSVAADTAQMTKLFIKTSPIFESTPVVRIQGPNFAATNHRRSRIESFVIASTSLKGTMRFLAIRNIFCAEAIRIIDKLRFSWNVK